MGVTCPSCGGAAIVPVGGRWFRCSAELWVDRHPGQDNVPHPHRVPVACDHRFFVGGGLRTASCERGGCGLDSIGTCPDCGKRLCYQHYGSPCGSCRADAEFESNQRRQVALASEQDWLASSASAREVVKTLNGGVRYRAGGERAFTPRHVLEAWRRLAVSGKLPATDLQLARARRRRIRTSVLGRAWQAVPEDRLGPVWMAPEALAREGIGDSSATWYRDAVIDSDGVVYMVEVITRLQGAGLGAWRSCRVSGQHVSGNCRHARSGDADDARAQLHADNKGGHRRGRHTGAGGARGSTLRSVRSGSDQFKGRIYECGSNSAAVHPIQRQAGDHALLIVERATGRSA